MIPLFLEFFSLSYYALIFIACDTIILTFHFEFLLLYHKGCGQNQRALAIKEWVPFQNHGRESAKPDLAFNHLIVIGALSLPLLPLLPCFFFTSLKIQYLSHLG